MSTKKLNVKDLVPGMSHVNIEHTDGAVCGVLIVQDKKSKKVYVSFRSNLYSAVNSVSSALRNGNHPNKRLQEAYWMHGVNFFTFPTDTVGEAVDLRNSIIDEWAHHDVFLNIIGANHVKRVIKQLARTPGQRNAKVKVDGVVYESRREAALAYGFTVSTVAYRLKNPAYSNWVQL